MPDNYSNADTPITAPRVSLIDERTGLISRAWYMFFLSLNTSVLNITNNIVAPDTISIMSSYDNALAVLEQSGNIRPLPIDTVVELQKQVDALSLSASPIDTVVELQKQVDALSLSPFYNSATTSSFPVTASDGTVFKIIVSS